MHTKTRLKLSSEGLFSINRVFICTHKKELLLFFLSSYSLFLHKINKYRLASISCVHMQTN